MNINHFNAALILGWLLVLIGGCLLNPGAGLAVGGLLLIALVIGAARAAGLYDPAAVSKETD
jgi:hypothetical protein